MLGAITLDLFAVLLGGVTAMLPVYARDILQVGAEGLGRSAPRPAVGRALTALFLASAAQTNVGVKMLAPVVCSASRPSSSACRPICACRWRCSRVLGAADMFSVYIRPSLIQLHTPDEMRGRVAAASTLFISASNELAKSAAASPPRCSDRSPQPSRRRRRDRRHPALGLVFPGTSPRRRFADPTVRSGRRSGR